MKLPTPLLLFLSAPFAALLPADEALKPQFRPGEALRYDLKWSVFKVGSARLQVYDLVEFEGEKAWHFSFHVRTNGFADAFFKVRTRIDTWVSEDLRRTLFYKEKKREGKTRRDIEIKFDWEKRQATYANFGEKRDPIDLPEGPVLDPVGAVYRFRSLPLALGESYAFTVTDGKKAVRLSLPLDKEDRIKVDAGRFNTYRIEPETGELGGVFEKSDDSEVRIWFSSDRMIYPVQVQGEVVVGSFWAELDAIEIRDPANLE